MQFGESLITASPLALIGKNMQALTVKSIESKGHQEIKVLFWILFGSTRGAPVRTKIVKLLRKQPYNTNQLYQELSLDYKAVKHHMDILEKNNLIDKLNVAHISTYFFSPLFEENRTVFDEIESKMFSNTKSNNNFEGY